MPEPVRIDSHMHIYRGADEGIAEKEGYQIWEYGDKPGVKRPGGHRRLGRAVHGRRRHRFLTKRTSLVRVGMS